MIKYVEEATIPHDGILLIPIDYSYKKPLKTRLPKAFLTKFDEIGKSIFQLPGEFGPGVFVRYETPGGKRMFGAFIDCLVGKTYSKESLKEGIEFFTEIFENNGVAANFYFPAEILPEIGTELEWFEMDMINDFGAETPVITIIT